MAHPIALRMRGRRPLAASRSLAVVSDDIAGLFQRLGGRRCDVIHYLYCSDGSTARRLAQRLSGWIVTIFPPGEEITRWEVHAARLDVILTEAAAVAASDQLRALAAEFGAEYAGWKCEQSPAR
jgi:hypothetical protein